MVIFKFCCCVQGLSTSGSIRGLCVNPAGILLSPLCLRPLCGRYRVALGWYEALEGSPNTAKITHWPFFLSLCVYPSCEQRQHTHTCLMNGSFCLVYSAVETPWSDSHKKREKTRNSKAWKCGNVESWCPLPDTQKC